MTISYQRDVASSTAGGFTRLLFKWKGSLYKLIYRELLLFLSAYVLLSLIYRQILTKNQRSLFEMVVKYFDAFLNLIPLSFVLGFYVSYVAGRWWQQFLAIPWPDKLFHSIACFLAGFDEESRMLRRSLMRYMNLALILVLRSISSAVKQRFPTLEHVVEAGFMTNQEKELFQAVPSNEFNTYWIPCTWFIYRLQEAAKKGKLLNPYGLETIMREFCEFRAKCGLLWCYDWVSIPMVYTQVVTLATYLFFIFTVIGRQKIDTMKKGDFMRSGRMPMDIDLYIPIFTILQFFFYMGLLKVAEQLINPFGDDDEDFELNWLIDRHMKASFLGCDILMDPDRIPPMVKDYYWDKQNCPIPYTEASMHFKRQTYKGSAADMIVPEAKQHMVLPEIEEEDEADSQRHSRLSLTSLLLETNFPGALVGAAGAAAGATDRADVQPRQGFVPGSWRSGRQANPLATKGMDEGGETRLGVPDNSLLRRLSDSNIQSFLGLGKTLTTGTTASMDSVTDDEETERRGSASGSLGFRRGSRFAEDPRKRARPERKRKKDKQGFVWRRMIPELEEELPRSRTPQLGQAASVTQVASLPALQIKVAEATPPPSNLADVPDALTATVTTTTTTMASRSLRNAGGSLDTEDTTSVASFRTCPSEASLALRPAGTAGRPLTLTAGAAVRPSSTPTGWTKSRLLPTESSAAKLILKKNSYAADPPPPLRASSANLALPALHAADQDVPILFRPRSATSDSAARLARPVDLDDTLD